MPEQPAEPVVNAASSPLLSISVKRLGQEGYSQGSGPRFYRYTDRSGEDSGDNHIQIWGKVASPDYHPSTNPNPQKMLTIEGVELKQKGAGGPLKRLFLRTMGDGKYFFPITSLELNEQQVRRAKQMFLLIPEELRHDLPGEPDRARPEDDPPAAGSSRHRGSDRQDESESRTGPYRSKHHRYHRSRPYDRDRDSRRDRDRPYDRY